MKRRFLLIASFVTLAACSNSGGSGVKKTNNPCSGSGLAVNPIHGKGCATPASPTQGCSTTSVMGGVSNLMLESSMPAQQSDEEVAVALDPRPGTNANQNTVFVATIQSDVVSSSGSPGEPTATCVSGKHIAVYRTNDSGILTQMSGLPAPPPAHEWATDPSLGVGPDGTLYLTFLRWTAPCGSSTSGTCTMLCNTADFMYTDVEIWFAPPGSTVLQPGLPDNQNLLSALPSINTGFPRQAGQNPGIVGTESESDHPKMAVNPTTPGQSRSTSTAARASQTRSTPSSNRPAPLS